MVLLVGWGTCSGDPTSGSSSGRCAMKAYQMPGPHPQACEAHTRIFNNVGISGTLSENVRLGRDNFRVVGRVFSLASYGYRPLIRTSSGLVRTAGSSTIPRVA
jgi:hypothetical protein